ncbi:PEF-CTERM sorting domain-containing protein [uncultured Methanolobus sp.]|uniref:PEF-CTERM sorting domain-containing protein n=1 Tax=uncultured Methanolobus sp. TaxID=218300 RepID=UPI002AAB4C45|nr:PEF-CTERM sorting domain-containing protein [uncultured Methanolobus sp.]
MDAVRAITSTGPASDGEGSDDNNQATPSHAEFPAIAIPMIAIMGLALIYGRKKQLEPTKTIVYQTIVFFFISVFSVSFILFSLTFKSNANI